MDIDYIAIGRRVRGARRRRGYSQWQLAEIINCAPTYISYIESGKKSMSMETFIKLANALNVSADELMVDCLETTIKVSNHSFANLLADCSEYERRLLLDVATSLKASIRANGKYQRGHRYSV